MLVSDTFAKEAGEEERLASCNGSHAVAFFIIDDKFIVAKAAITQEFEKILSNLPGKSRGKKHGYIHAGWLQPKLIILWKRRQNQEYSKSLLASIS